MRLRRLFLLNAVVFTGFVGHGRMIAVVHAVAGRRPRSAAVGIGLAFGTGADAWRAADALPRSSGLDLQGPNPLSSTGS